MSVLAVEAAVGTLLAPAGVASGALPRVYGDTSRAFGTPMEGTVETFQIDRSGNVLSLTVLDTVIRQPGLLRAYLGNGVAGGTVYLFLDGIQSQTAILDDSGMRLNLRIAVSGLAAGAHTVSASATPVAPTTRLLAFSTLNGVITVSGPVAVTPPAVVAPGRWVFQSYDRDEFGRVTSLVLPINPGSVVRQFGNININSEASVFGGTIASWEGAAQPTSWNWTGRLLTQEQYRAMAFWGRSTQRIYLTDHLGDRYLVKVSQYQTTRVRDIARPWHHTYTMTVAVLTGGIGALPDIKGKAVYHQFEAPRGVAAGGVGGPAALLSGSSYPGTPVGGVTGAAARGSVAAPRGGTGGGVTATTSPLASLLAPNGTVGTA